MLEYLIFVPVAYLMGSVPFGLLATRLAKGVDVRDYGSGKTGMTNVLRIAGVRAGFVVLVLDMSKGALAVVIARLVWDSPGLAAAAGLSVLLGHLWPVFIGFRGGRGTATGMGALVALSPLAGLATATVGLPMLVAFRYVSLGSISGAITGAATLLILSLVGFHPTIYALYGVVGGALVLAKHHDNIRRLLTGRERKLGQTGETHDPPGKAGKQQGAWWRRLAL